MALYNYITSTGVIIPDTSTLLNDVQTEFTDTFGDDLNLDPETPQGILITGETLARAAVVDNNALLANQINPNLSVGVFLDAICALTGLARTPATFSTVTANLAGVPGTVIDTNSIAALVTGEQFSPVSSIILDSDGNGSGTFQALLPGPITAPAGTLTTIVSGVIGWETVTNPSSGTLGTNIQSDQQLQRLRALTLALQGVSLNEAIISGLYASINASWGGVTSLQYRENYTSETLTIDGVTLVANSIYVVITNSNAILGYTLIQGNLTGTAGTIIPAGSVVADTSSQQYASLSAITLDSNGNGTGIFQSVSPGVFSTAIGDLTTIVSTLTGWEAVDNTTPSTVYSVDFLNQVAKILLSKKSLGANWNGGPGSPPYGAYTVQVTDSTSGQLYTVTFGTPTSVPIVARATITLSPTFVGDPVSTVQNAILDYVNSDDGWGVGVDISAFNLASAVNQIPGILINNMQISLADDIDYSNNTIDLELWQQGKITAGGIQVLLT
jgi:uncharacterized phage protein gp47/JayE